MLVSCFEYPRYKPFLLTMVSYLKKQIKIQRTKKSHEPFQSYLLTGQARPRLGVRGILFSLWFLFIFLKYETIARSSAWSFSHSDSDSSSVTKNQLPVDLCPQNSTAEVTLTKSLLLQACWSQGAMAPAYFKRSVNPISTRLCPLHYYWPPNTHLHQWALYHDLFMT